MQAAGLGYLPSFGQDILNKDGTFGWKSRANAEEITYPPDEKHDGAYGQARDTLRLYLGLPRIAHTNLQENTMGK